MMKRRLEELKERICSACERSKRNPDGVQLVLVTKEVSVERIKEAYDLGMRDFGENRVQELVEKQRQLPQDVRWHFIGHLQTNKVKAVVGNVVLIHSLDRLRLADEIQKQAVKNKQTQAVLIQVNVAREGTKYGFDPKAVEEAVSYITSDCDRLNLCGLMAIGPNTEDSKRIHSSFHELFILRDQLRKRFPRSDWEYLSMGMSADFELAIEEGANMLRLGSAVFGPREKR